MRECTVHQEINDALAKLLSEGAVHNILRRQPAKESLLREEFDVAVRRPDTAPGPLRCLHCNEVEEQPIVIEGVVEKVCWIAGCWINVVPAAGTAGIRVTEKKASFVASEVELITPPGSS